MVSRYQGSFRQCYVHVSFEKFVVLSGWEQLLVVLLQVVLLLDSSRCISLAVHLVPKAILQTWGWHYVLLGITLGNGLWAADRSCWLTFLHVGIWLETFLPRRTYASCGDVCDVAGSRVMELRTCGWKAYDAVRWACTYMSMLCVQQASA